MVACPWFLVAPSQTSILSIYIPMLKETHSIRHSKIKTSMENRIGMYPQGKVRHLGQKVK